MNENEKPWPHWGQCPKSVRTCPGSAAAMKLLLKLQQMELRKDDTLSAANCAPFWDC